MVSRALWACAASVSRCRSFSIVSGVFRLRDQRLRVGSSVNLAMGSSSSRVRSEEDSSKRIKADGPHQADGADWASSGSGIERLPDDVLRRVFKHALPGFTAPTLESIFARAGPQLPRARDLALVSRRWYRVARPGLWRVTSWTEAGSVGDSVKMLATRRELLPLIRHLEIKLLPSVQLGRTVENAIFSHLRLDNLLLSSFRPVSAITAFKSIVALHVFDAQASDVALFITANPSIRKLQVTTLHCTHSHSLPLGQITHLGIGNGLRAERFFAPSLKVLDIGELLEDDDGLSLYSNSFPRLEHLTVRSWPAYVDPIFQNTPASLSTIVLNVGPHDACSCCECVVCLRRLPALIEIIELQPPRIRRLVLATSIKHDVWPPERVLHLRRVCKAANLELFEVRTRK